MYAIVNIGVCSPESIDLFRSFFSNTNVLPRVRTDFGYELYCSAFTNGVAVTNRAAWAGCVEDYAATANKCFTPLDDVMIWANPSYRYSKRRLSVLRSVRDLGMHPYQLAYVTNAINELVSYPEANLSD